MESSNSLPVVLVMAGLDPTGGAGIQADIESLASMGCHCAPLVTALTAQDTHRVHSFTPVDPNLVREQSRRVLDDIPVAAIKLGMLGSIAMVQVAAEVIARNPAIPVVLDPVLAAGGGGSLGQSGIIEAVIEMLVPATTIITPNSVEARALVPSGSSLDQCAKQILARGSEFVLITGTHEPGLTVENRFYADGRLLESFTWERLPESFHGSGCTLSSAIAGLLAAGLEPFNAVHEAQEFTWEALRHGYRVGAGQRVPDRFFWTREAAGDQGRPDSIH